MDAYFNLESHAAYPSLICQMPEHALSSIELKRIEEYAGDTFGSKSFAAWLKVYAAFRGEFLEGWIPMDYWCRIVCSSLNGSLQPIGRVKTLTQKFLHTSALPDLAYHVNGSWVLSDGEPSDALGISQTLLVQYPVVFLKSDHSSQGKDIRKVAREDFLSIDFKALGDFVLQAPIIQHPFFEQISPGSVASLRITTLKLSTAPAEALQSGLRLGLRGATHVYLPNCVVLPVWIGDGKLYDCGFLGAWERVFSHPDTEVAFSGLQIPKFQEMKNFCAQLHDRNPHFGMIAWDVVLDADEQVKLMEWNTVTPSFEMSEAATGPHFKGLGLEDLWKKNNPGLLGRGR